VEDFFFLPTMRSFTRKLGESILATPSEFSVNACSRHRTSVNRKEVRRHPCEPKVQIRNRIVPSNINNSFGK